jgi:hypothetical protein
MTPVQCGRVYNPGMEILQLHPILWSFRGRKEKTTNNSWLTTTFEAVAENELPRFIRLPLHRW